jgi:hypothetical protein
MLVMMGGRGVCRDRRWGVESEEEGGKDLFGIIIGNEILGDNEGFIEDIPPKSVRA